LGVPSIPYVRVSAEEASQHRIINPAVHVDEAEVVEVFVVGEAAAQAGVEGGGGPPVRRRQPAAPGC
jgi:hypothetical protein